jgi:hypothetical protein
MPMQHEHHKPSSNANYVRLHLISQLSMFVHMLLHFSSTKRVA